MDARNIPATLIGDEAGNLPSLNITVPEPSVPIASPVICYQMPIMRTPLESRWYSKPCRSSKWRLRAPTGSLQS